MIKIEINNKIYKLPVSFDEILLKDYIKLMNIKELDDTKRLMLIVSSLTGCPVEDISSLKLDDIRYLFHSIQYIFEQPKYVLQPYFKIDGIYYGLNKNLEQITFGEYIDLEKFSNGDLDWKDIDILLSILYRPVQKKPRTNNFIKNYIYNKRIKTDIEEYNPETVKERSELFKNNITIDKVLGAVFFFIVLRMVYMKSLELSLSKRKKMRMLNNMLNQIGISLNNVGVG